MSPHIFSRITGIAATLASLGFCAAQADPIGTRSLMVEAPHHSRDMRVTLFYPAAEDSGQQSTVAENAVFYGHQMWQDAAPAAGQQPVVLMSHGLGGLTRSLTWLGEGLAARGAIVVGVDHPNTSFGDFDMVKGMDHWTRAQDMAVALDALQGDATFAPHMDLTRVHATGFSYGGWTALSLGGLRGDGAAYALYCDQAEGKSTHCNDLVRAGVDLRDVDQEKWQADWRLPEVTSVAAIDPGLTYGITQEMADDLAVPALLLTLGNAADRLQATDLSARGSDLWAKLPEAARVVIDPASHFTALPRCKPMGEAILAEEQDDPVCTDPEGTDRAAVHAQVIDAIADHFGF
ncbi:putative dienelactone hydrolase [Tritonibacter multivorans]|uniref:Putative dienelactone hydrolase n=1 Tax=Tritonibacter multivorans TaxID=928856 RepID=A0A0P1GBR6_9RHOB|nr:hypothetical protein [Tritonibacter multivorans]MDA7421387.1 hypothetical protein [Tritonibacter multivorans]CUH78879.1 putative dienelactone hydrolase [Tritonibacter multivorans]SFD28191.1 Predicted dienelactone hydrolase [Tritonibacter multivorans]